MGGAAGFALGGPLGALVGAAAGHMVDRVRKETREAIEQGESDGRLGQSSDAKQMAFTVGVIVLAAKLAKADGQVTRDEVETFKTVFKIPTEGVGDVGAIFDEAKRSASGFEPYARQIADIFGGQPTVLESLLDALFAVAMADGVMHDAERDYLARVAFIFGLTEQRFESVAARHVSPEQSDPYEILGVKRDIDDDALKQHYRKLVREHHPDKLTAQGMPEEFVAEANETLARINAAYDQIQSQRGLT